MGKDSFHSYIVHAKFHQEWVTCGIHQQTTCSFDCKYAGLENPNPVCLSKLYLLLTKFHCYCALNFIWFQNSNIFIKTLLYLFLLRKRFSSASYSYSICFMLFKGPICNTTTTVGCNSFYSLYIPALIKSSSSCNFLKTDRSLLQKSNTIICC
jgi:hypothetical protein